MLEEVCETKEMTSYKTTNWEERIEHKINMLFDEILDLRSDIENIRSNFFIDKITKEKKELENQLEDKIRIIQNIDNNYSHYYSLRCEKRNIFNGIKER